MALFTLVEDFLTVIARSTWVNGDDLKRTMGSKIGSSTTSKKWLPVSGYVFFNMDFEHCFLIYFIYYFNGYGWHSTIGVDTLASVYD